MSCGGVSAAQPANSLEGDAAAADAFVRAKVPELANATLESYTTQVVAGARYGFKYAGYPDVVYVWVKAWENFMQITLHDGTEIVNNPVVIAVQQP
jgi:hypothetical protein